MRQVLYGRLKPEDIIIEGEARGADRMARDIAISMGLEVLRFPAEWTKYHYGAGPKRNQQMLDEGKPELVYAFHNNLSESTGTKDMVARARQAGILVVCFG